MSANSNNYRAVGRLKNSFNGLASNPFNLVSSGIPPKIVPTKYGPNYKIDNSLITSFDEGSIWVHSIGGYASVTQDYYQSGFGSINVTSPDPAATVHLDYLGGELFSVDYDKIYLWCYFPTETSAYTITLNIAQGGDLNNKFSTTFSNDNALGWTLFIADKVDFSSYGSPSWESTFDSIRVSWSAETGKSVYFDSLYSKAKAVPNVIFTFDDGVKSDYDIAYPYMASKGFVGTSFLVTGFVDVLSGTLTSTMIGQMYSDGWEFGNHTRDHNNLTTVSEAVAQLDIENGRDDLISWGITGAENYLAYPQGAYIGIESVVKAAGVIAARTTQPEYIQTASGRINNLRYPLRLGIAQNTTFTDCKNAVDKAIEDGVSVIFSCHGLSATPEAYESNLAAFIGLVDYVYEMRVAKKVFVKTFKDFIEGLDTVETDYLQI